MPFFWTNMPNRIIKESICTSEDIDGLSERSEIMFYRLMVNADDYGRFDARPKLISSKCYPLKSIDINSINICLKELSSAGLIILYESDGRQYGCFSGWEKHQQIRAKRAKFPGPSDQSAIICNHMPSYVPVIQSNPIQSEPVNRPVQQDASPKLPPDGFIEFWETWPTTDRKQAKGKCLDAWKKASAERDAALVIAHVESMKNSREWQKQDGEFIPAPLVYLNQRRWEGAESSAPVNKFAGAI